VRTRTVYVAGPFNSNGAVGVLGNMRRGIRTCIELLVKHNFAPFCPWNDAFFALLTDEEIPIEKFYAYSLAWLEKSDAVLVLPGWENSKGTCREMARASDLGIPIFFDIDALLEWRDELDQRGAEEDLMAWESGK